MSTPKRHRNESDSRSLEAFVDAPNDAGVGEQDDECPNGQGGCPGSDCDLDEVLPCFPCFLEADR